MEKMRAITITVIIIIFFSCLEILSINFVHAYSDDIYNNKNEKIEIEQETEIIGLSAEKIIGEQLEKLNLEEIEREVEKINKNTENYLPQLSIKDILFAFINGNLELDWLQVIRGVLGYMGREVAANLRLLGQIVILAVISAVFNIFHNSFSSRSISDTARTIIFLLLAVMVLQAFRLAVNVGLNAVEDMVSFMNAFLPVIISLLLGIGALSSAVIFHPLTFLIVSALSNIIKYVVLPMIFLSTILSIVTRINEEYSLSKLAGLFKEISMGLLGLILILLVGGLLLQGGAAALTDGLSLRTAKYLTGTFVPVIGGIFSDALDLIVSCSMIIKNAVNIFGMISIIFIVSFPLIKITALIIIYRIAGALVQPIADEKLVGIINDIGNSMIMLFLVVAAVSFMFFIILTVIIAAANLTVMMR